MLTFEEFRREEGIDYFVVEMPEHLIPEKSLLHEGRWMPSSKNGWVQRVDAANPDIKQQRHVHVARSKHISSKNKQAAWNSDGTKHDKKSFNSQVGSTAAVQLIAKQALGLPDDFKLDEASKAASLLLQVNEATGIDINPKLFVLVRA